MLGVIGRVGALGAQGVLGVAMRRVTLGSSSNPSCRCCLLVPRPLGRCLLKAAQKVQMGVKVSVT